MKAFLVAVLTGGSCTVIGKKWCLHATFPMPFGRVVTRQSLSLLAKISQTYPILVQFAAQQYTSWKS